LTQGRRVIVRFWNTRRRRAKKAPGDGCIFLGPGIESLVRTKKGAPG
jgi:hypothetical protein